MKSPPSSLREHVLASVATRPSPTRSAHHQRRLALALLVLAIIVAAGSMMAGRHADVPARPTNYLVTILAICAVVALLVAYGTLGPTPSALGRSSRVHRWLTITTPCLLALGALIANALAPSTLVAQTAPEMTHVACSTVTLLAGAAVLAILLVLERRSSTTSALVKGASLGTVAAAWATLFISISCPYAHPLHVVPTHILVPIIPLVVGGMVAGVRILSIRAEDSAKPR